MKTIIFCLLSDTAAPLIYTKEKSLDLTLITDALNPNNIGELENTLTAHNLSVPKELKCFVSVRCRSSPTARQTQQRIPY